MAKKKSKNPEKENNKSKQYVLKHSSLFRDRSTNTNSIITRSEIPYVPAKSHATSNSTHDSGISPPSPSPAFHPSGRSIPTVRNFGPAPDYHEINCQSQFHPRSAPRKERQREGGGGGAASLTRLVPQRPRDIMAWPASLIPFRGCQLESGRWCLPETSVGRYTPPFPVRLDLIEKNSGYIGVTPSFERGMISRDFNSFPSFSFSFFSWGSLIVDEG